MKTSTLQNPKGPHLTPKLIPALLALCTAAALAQTKPAQTTPAPAAKPAAPPLQLQSLDQQTQPDPFPPVDPKNFTADSPTVATVDAYLHAVLGYDAGRIWRVVGIQKTASPGVSRVTAAISERGPNAKVLTAQFYIMPDGKHLIADGTGLTDFGPNPYAQANALLKTRADGPANGATAKDLLLVEFADLQCPHCKDAQPVMARLATDFPQARIVYQSFPLAEIHPFAFQAAAYGACIAAKSNPAFFTYAQAVYDTQGALTAEAGQQTLAAAVTKAGQDPTAIANCAATPAIKAQVNASEDLGRDVGVNQTPMLSINGRLVPLTSLPYETLVQVIVFQAAIDGVTVTAPALTH